MSKFKPIETISSRLSSIPVVHGQYIVCTDSKDNYFDSTDGRVKIGDIILLDTEEDREGILAPLIDKLYVVKTTNKLYRHNGSEWLCLSNNNTIYSQRKTYKITTNTAKITLGIPALDINKDTVLVFLNSVFLEEGVDYVIDNSYLSPAPGETQWEATTSAPLHFNLVIIKNIPDRVSGGQDNNNEYLEGRVATISQENASLLYIMMTNKIDLRTILTYDKFSDLYKNKLWTQEMFSKAIEMGVLKQSDYDKIRQ